MNTDANLNLLRQILTVLGGLLAGYGIGNPDQWSHIANDIAVAVPALVSLGSIAWSIYAHWKQVKVPEQTPVIPPGADVAISAHAAVQAGLLTTKGG